MQLSPFQGGSLLAPLDELLKYHSVDTTANPHQIASECMQRWVIDGAERREHPEVPAVMPEDKFWELIQLIGLWHPIMPKGSHFDYALLLGGTLPPQRRRLAHLATAWNTGTRFDRIVNLAGDRPLLLNGTESIEALVTNSIGSSLPIRPDWRLSGHPFEYEWDMMELVLQQTKLPPGMTELPVTTTRATKSTGFRAHTGDTVRAWLDERPTPGSILMVTVQPHLHQHAHVRLLLPKEFELETIAAGAQDGPLRRIYFLGAIARWLKFNAVLAHT